MFRFLEKQWKKFVKAVCEEGLSSDLTDFFRRRSCKKLKISYGRCSDTPHVSFSWGSVVNQSPPITEGGWRPSCLVILRRFIGDFWSWILAIGHDICQIMEMLNFTFFSSKFSWHLFTYFQIRSVQQSAKALRLSAKERRLDSKLKGDTKTQHR